MNQEYEIREGGGKLKKRLSLGLRLAVSLGLIGYIGYSISRSSDLTEIPRYYGGADYFWLAGAVGLILCLLSLGALRWGILLRAQDVRLSAWSVLMYFMIGMFFNNFLPSTVGGDAIKVYYLHRFAGKGKEGLVSVLIDRLAGIAGLCVVANVALLTGWGSLRSIPVLAERATLIYLVVGGLTAALCLFFAVAFNDRVMRLFFRLIPERLRGIKEKIRRTHDCLLVYRGRREVLAKALLVSTVIWVLIVGSCWMIYRAFYSPSLPVPPGKIPFIPLGYFYLFLPTIAALMSVPISFGGLGTREAFFILFFTALPGVSNINALMISLNYYFAFLLASALGGIIYIFKDQLKFHREIPAP